MEAVRTSETSVSSNDPTHRYILDDSKLQTNENLILVQHVKKLHAFYGKIELKAVFKKADFRTLS
jgi:hypothetical protein